MVQALPIEAVEVAGERRSSRLPLGCAYLIEALTSVSLNFLMIGVVFFTTKQFGWSTKANMLLMMAQGVVYTIGALAAGVFARRFPKPKLLVAVNAMLLPLVCLLASVQSQWLFVPILLAATCVSTLTWPLVESLVTEGCSARQMNRRITLYNMSWSSVCVGVIAIYGTVLSCWPRGPMIVPIIAHAIALIAAIVLAKTHRAPKTDGAEPKSHDDPAVAAQLASHRRMALWLSRISLPASFVVANSLMGMFPKLQISEQLGVAWATVIASLWMASRFPTFILLGRTNWWHTRPRLLLVGGVLMLAAFLLIALPGDRIGPFASLSVASQVMLIAGAEIVLGVMAGYVLSASLYFGMVLSDGSTDHGGYHEALIGLGVILGPGLAAGAQALGPVEARWPAIAAVSGLMVVTLASAAFVASRMRGK